MVDDRNGSGDNYMGEDSGTYFEHVGDFVHKHLVHIVNRKANNRDTFWCPQWWKHPEAMERLTALWLTWEQSREDPAAISVWWRDHLDYHLPVLMSSTGSFRYCETGKHDGSRYEKDALKVEDYPENLFRFLK